MLYLPQNENFRFNRCISLQNDTNSDGNDYLFSVLYPCFLPPNCIPHGLTLRFNINWLCLASTVKLVGKYVVNACIYS